ncbi:hypothetical protein [Pectobacterium cacticida]|uniref:TadE/TadG family type IV pilus assembly protein n=1 Tax=Pectobacterium cacticida TaxID=69221 RepID=UPI002FF0DF2B
MTTTSSAATTLRRFWRAQRASIAVETALALPIVLAAGMLFADFYSINLERSRMEQRAGALASVLALQKSLTTDGLSGLLNSVLPDANLGDYQLLISNVRQTGMVNWQLSRGNTPGLCAGSETPPGESYVPDLPERDVEKGSENTTMLLVEWCREGKDLGLLGGMALGGLLHVSAVNRVAIGAIELDETLAKEAGIANEDEGR